MPRPKVPLENRKRAVRACSHCRSSKKRCNGQQPCSNCVRKGITHDCVFEDTPSAAPSQRTRNPSNAGFQHSPPSGPSIHTPSNQTQSPATTIVTLASSPEASHRTHPRLLDNSQGEKVFFGGSASLAFLQLIRDSVAQSLGKSDFTQNVAQNHMLEEPRAQALPVSDVALSTDQMHAFVDLYLMVVRGLINIHRKGQILATLSKQQNANASWRPLELAVMQTVIAIGAQCSPRDHANLTISRSYFAEAQRQAFAGMIEDASFEMVELFLLMAFYMFGACHRNAAFMYIGVAVRGAYVLGLHQSWSDGKTFTDRSRYLRAKAIWKSLITLDTITSAILGRPSATYTGFFKMQGQQDFADPGVNSAMQANFELACLMDQKVQGLYHTEKVTAEGARACLDELNSWSSQLPTAVRLPSSTIQAVTSQAQVVGGLHVSCFYYFAVMLVSRPFLVVSLTNRLAQTRAPPRESRTDPAEGDIEAEVQEIGNACLNAATYMIQTCVETKKYGFLPENMRILKAWVFAAGLVLGFEMFTVQQSDPEIEDAFQGSRDILKTLSAHSAQAAHYFDILISLSDAIATRRRQALAEKRRNARPIVERIMAFQPPSATISSVDSAATTGSDADPLTTSTNDGGATESWISGMNFDFDFQDMMNEPFLNWESTDFLSWDPFSGNLPP